MLSIVKAIDRCASQLPASGGVSSTVNPRPLLELLRHVNRGLALTEICLQFYHSKQEPTEDWLDPENDNERSKPWHAYDEQVWMARADALRITLVNHYSALAQSYSDFSPLAVDRSRQFRASEMIYFLGARIEMCVYSRRSPQARARMSAVKPTDLEFIARNELAVDNSPVLSMPCSKALESLRHLFLRMVSQCYNEQLELYWELLEHRLQRLIVYGATELDHDVADMRSKPVTPASGGKGAPMYSANGKLLSTVTIFSCALHQRFYCARLFERVQPPPEFPEEREIVQALYEWFIRRAKNMTSRQSSKSIRERTLESNLMPGELEMYHYEFPRDDDGVLSILSRNRGDAFQRTVDNASRPVADIIEKDLPKVVVGAPEPVLVQFALLEMTELTMRHSCDGAALFDHASLELDMGAQLEDLKRTDRPRIVQLFNHWQLLYRKQIYCYDSFIRTLAAWFHFTYRDFGGKLSQRLQLHDWAEEIFGTQMYYRTFLRSSHIPTVPKNKTAFGLYMRLLLFVFFHVAMKRAREWFASAVGVFFWSDDSVQPSLGKKKSQSPVHLLDLSKEIIPVAPLPSRVPKNKTWIRRLPPAPTNLLQLPRDLLIAKIIRPYFSTDYVTRSKLRRVCRAFRDMIVRPWVDPGIDNPFMVAKGDCRWCSLSGLPATSGYEVKVTITTGAAGNISKDYHTWICSRNCLDLYIAIICDTWCKSDWDRIQISKTLDKPNAVSIIVRMAPKPEMDFKEQVRNRLRAKEHFEILSSRMNYTNNS